MRDFLGEHGGAICGPYSRQTTGANWSNKKFENLTNWLSTPFNKSAINNRGRLAVIGCPGDFVLMHRDAFAAVRGYPEVPIPVALDDVMVVAAVHLGLDCVSGCCCYCCCCCCVLEHRPRLQEWQLPACVDVLHVLQGTSGR